MREAAQEWADYIAARNEIEMAKAKFEQLTFDWTGEGAAIGSDRGECHD